MQLQPAVNYHKLHLAQYEALAVAVFADDRPLAGKCVARVLQACWMPSNVVAHVCDAWFVQSWGTQECDGAAMAALGVGGPKLLHTLNKAGYLPNYNTGGAGVT